MNISPPQQDHFIFPQLIPDPPKIHTLVRLEGTPINYLMMSSFDKPQKKSMILFPIIGIGSLILSLFLGIGASITIVYNGVRKGVVEADRVLNELHQGNLKARFNINRKDGFGEAMLRFNLMADEIEKLVLNLKDAEQSRTRFFQELAHDLRTPIASLKSLMETLEVKRNTLDPKVQNELTGLALKEINYFERLVEDLLFLAQIKSPSDQLNRSLVNLSDLLSETVDDFSLRSAHREKQIDLQLNLDPEPLFIHGDPHLLTRLIRNALENAFDFAHSKVLVSIQKSHEEEKKIKIIIEDDGPGFSEEALKSFGTRRISRKLESNPNGRISVGLGSVVMKSICYTYNGKIEVANRTHGLTTAGARITLYLNC